MVNMLYFHVRDASLAYLYPEEMVHHECTRSSNSKEMFGTLQSEGRAIPFCQCVFIIKLL